jgi:hypothetical protein
MVENLNTIFPNMNDFLKDKNFKWCPTVWEFRTILLLYCIAEMACKRKHSKYSSIISSNYVFKGLAFETLGLWCKEAIDFINVIGNRLIAEIRRFKIKEISFREDFPCHSTWKRYKHSGHFSRFRIIIGNDWIRLNYEIGICDKYFTWNTDKLFMPTIIEDDASTSFLCQSYIN